MSFRLSAKKLAIASALVTPLVLAACGSGDSDSEDTNANSTSSSTTAASSGASSSKQATESGSATPTEGETTVHEPSPEEAEAASSAVAAAAANPEITFANLTPVEAGQPATPEQAAEIEGLVRGQLNETSLRSFMTYIPNNTCSRVLADQGVGQADFNEIPDIPLSAIGADSGTIDSISEIQVEGDSASALVTASASGTTDTGVQRFLHEDGRWKFCN
ncbi:hypothetical protein [Corynebacterium pacaense]|uniref:hypothetical protein n=1 Tax=Corynebacterium pacaense TaxID=1816684 RepID=UPI001FE5A3C8|nr:hypothetical protein [Corynebacterium pacaense]